MRPRSARKSRRIGSGAGRRRAGVRRTGLCGVIAGISRCDDGRTCRRNAARPASVLGSAEGSPRASDDPSSQQRRRGSGPSIGGSALLASSSRGVQGRGVRSARRCRWFETLAQLETGRRSVCRGSQKERPRRVPHSGTGPAADIRHCRRQRPLVARAAAPSTTPGRTDWPDRAGGEGRRPAATTRHPERAQGRRLSPHGEGSRIGRAPSAR